MISTPVGMFFFGAAVASAIWFAGLSLFFAGGRWIERNKCGPDCPRCRS